MRQRTCQRFGDTCLRKLVSIFLTRRRQNRRIYPGRRRWRLGCGAKDGKPCIPETEERAQNPCQRIEVTHVDDCRGKVRVTQRPAEGDGPRSRSERIPRHRYLRWSRGTAPGYPYTLQTRRCLSCPKRRK